MSEILVIWDLDGTVTRSQRCIFNSYKYAARKSGLPEPSDELLSTMMCGGLQEHMFLIFGMTGEEADILSRDFSEYYSEHYLQEVELFDGFPEVFESLKKAGIKQAVATMNQRAVAKEILKKMGLDQYFTRIAGADEEGRVTKTQMIQDCMSTGRYDRVVMIGDCPSDFRAAINAGVDFIVASYGYGYPRDACIEKKIPYASSPTDILEKLGL